MYCFQMGEILMESETVTDAAEYIILLDKKNWYQEMEEIGFSVERDILNNNGHFSKVESLNDYLYGTFSVPRVLDLLGKRHEISFFMNEKFIVIIDENGYALRNIEKIRTKKIHQAASKEQFLYNFVNQIFRNDISILEEYERKIIDMEEKIMDDKMHDFQKKMMPVRKELLVLKCYYEQISEMGKELEENENGLFIKKRMKYFRSITDKADRLSGKSTQLLDYSQQLRDVYQSQVDAKQNNTIEFLTIISTIFFPLTLITSWYGMNFKDMPELEHGYPYVILLCICIVIGTILLFKRKKIL
ncbi:MAG: CorA family divalent cation transporter [Lachnospiraceae bacterium]|nr:CorA family divalent cation transporter [Lachnospiraceae bacterium]